MSVRKTALADRDIINIFLDGALRFGVAQAQRYNDGLNHLFDLLADNPKMARLRTELSPPMRVHPYRVHVVAYVEESLGILIVRVLHGHQDWTRALS